MTRRSTPTLKSHHALLRTLRGVVLGLVVLLVSLSPARAQPIEWTRAVGPIAWIDTAMAYDSARGVTVVFGGRFDSTGGNYNGETWECDGTSWTRRATSGPRARIWSAMVYDTIRHVCVLFAGENQTGEADTWEWNGSTWTRRNVSGPSARYLHAMAYDAARGVTVLFGGWTGASLLGDTWEWNGTAWTQRAVPGPSARSNHAMAYDSARHVTVLYGGGNNETWEWNGTVWTQRTVSGPAARVSHAMAYDSARGVTVLCGGYDGNYHDETYEWDGTAWTQRADYPFVIVGHAMVYDSVRAVTVVFGGSYNSVNGEISEWNGSAWSRRGVMLPLGHWNAPMVYDAARGVCTFFGGYADLPDGGLAVSRETWSWDGTRWTLRSSTGPSAQLFSAMAYDSARGVAVLFGGVINQTALGETWEWDGTNWTQRFVSGPSPRFGHAMAYDAARGVTVLFGGNANNTQLGDTWEWNGSAWTLRDNAGSPRFAHAMIYDPIRAHCVVFGGHANNTNLGDTLEWDGTAWTVRATTGPTARYGHGMVYDSTRALTVLVGGVANIGSNGETWIWNGTAWAQATGTSVTRRDSFAMAYDAARDRVVLFGGERTNDTWLMHTLCDTPTIATQPAPQASCPGDTAAFSVGATTQGSLSYQWRRGTTDLADDANHISGAQTATLSLRNLSGADAGSYTCIVSDACGVVRTAPAVLTVGGPACTIDGTLVTQNRSVSASTSATALFCTPPDQDSGSQSAPDYSLWSPNLHVGSSMCSATMNADVTQDSFITPTHVYAVGVAAYSHGTLPSNRSVSATGASSFSYALHLSSPTSYSISGHAGTVSSQGLTSATARVAIMGPGGSPFTFQYFGGPFTDFASSGVLQPGDYTITALASFNFANGSINSPLSGNTHFDFDLRLAAPDANHNGVPDFADITTGTSRDCNADLIPDETQHLNSPTFDGSTSLSLNGSSRYVEVPNSPANNPLSFTVEIWVKYTGSASDSNYHTPLSSRWSPTNFAVLKGYNFYRMPDNTWLLMTGDGLGSGWTALQGPAVVPGAWTHLTATYDAASVTTRLYVNAVEVAFTVGAIYAPNTIAPLRIGAGVTESTARYFFQGQIDDVRIWDHARTPTQIALGMNERLAGNESGLNTLYQLDEGAGAVAHDSAAAGGTPQGALLGGTAWTPAVDCRCRADFNNDHIVNSADFFDFLTAFFGSSPMADVNHDGAVNSQDFFDFLGVFFAGC